MRLIGRCSMGWLSKKGPGTVDHYPLSVAPVLIKRDRLSALTTVVTLMGRMMHAVSEDHAFLLESLSVLERRDCLFDHAPTDSR